MSLIPHFTISADELYCRRTKGKTSEKCELDKIQKSVDDGWYVTIAQLSDEHHYFGGVKRQSGNIITFLDNTVLKVY